MPNRLICLPLLTGALILGGCDIENFGSSERYQSDFHYSYPLKPGGKITLENFNGSVEIAGWDQNNVDISGVKYGSSTEMRDAVKIEITPGDSSLYIRTVRPFEHHGNVGARYVLKVPRRIELDRITSSNGALRVSDVQGAAHLRTSNGSVRTLKLSGPLDAQTTNGAIEIEQVKGGANLRTSNGRVRADAVEGPLEAQTTNGGINIHMSDAVAGTPLKLTTSNGGIDLTIDSAVKSDIRASTTNGQITMHLPAALGARVHASTSNSPIVSDFEVHTDRTPDKHHMDGTIGAGGPLIDLSTSNGHIRLLKM